MITHEEIPAFAYEASPAEMQRIILDWVRATEEFHGRYAQLTEVINALQVTARRQPTHYRVRLRKLTALRQHMSDVLMTLMLDMSQPSSNRSQGPSKPGQLNAHARLLEQLNQEIDAELNPTKPTTTTVAQA